MPQRELVTIFLVTEKLDQLVSFYRDIVQLSLEKYEPGHSAWFDTGSVKLVIHKPESQGPPGSDYLPDVETVIWFRPKEDVNEAARALEKASITLLRPKNAQNYLFFKDPEGRTLGYHQSKSR